MSEKKADERGTATADASFQTAEPLATKEDYTRDARAVGAPVPQTVQVLDGGPTGSFDVVGGNIAQTFNQPLDTLPRDRTRAARLMIRAAKAMVKHPELGPLIGRPIDEWGLVGEGDTVIGHYVLIDLDSLEKVEVIDRWQIHEDRVFANAQQWPKALVWGETLAELSGGRKRDTEAQQAAEKEAATDEKIAAKS